MGTIIISKHYEYFSNRILLTLWSCSKENITITFVRISCSGRTEHSLFSLLLRALELLIRAPTEKWAQNSTTHVLFHLETSTRTIWFPWDNDVRLSGISIESRVGCLDLFKHFLPKWTAWMPVAPWQPVRSQQKRERSLGPWGNELKFKEISVAVDGKEVRRVRKQFFQRFQEELRDEHSLICEKLNQAIGQRLSFIVQVEFPKSLSSFCGSRILTWETRMCMVIYLEVWSIVDQIKKIEHFQTFLYLSCKETTLTGRTLRIDEGSEWESKWDISKNPGSILGAGYLK